MRLRSVALAMALLTGGAAIGATTQHLASASVSSGERPVLIPIEPCRLADTRLAPNTIGPRSAPLGTGDTHTIDAQQTGVPCSGIIPADASALSLNITALGATQQSFLTVWASGDRPLAASLNPAPGQPPVPNAVTTELSTDQEFRIYNDAGTVNIVVDVNGYYVDHNHDDRYYTEAEVDALVDAAVDAGIESYAGRPWSVPIGVGDFTTPTSGWPQVSLGQGLGLAYDDDVFGRAYFTINLPDNYVAGTDIAVSMKYRQVTGFGAPVFPCDSVWWSNGVYVYRSGASEFFASTTWETPRGFDSTQTRLRSTEASYDADEILETTMTIDGASLLPGDVLNLSLNRDGDETDDTCAGMKVMGLVAEPAG